MDPQEQTRMPDRSGDFITPRHMPTHNLRLFLNSAIISTISHGSRSNHPSCLFKCTYNTTPMAHLQPPVVLDGHLPSFTLQTLTNVHGMHVSTNLMRLADLYGHVSFSPYSLVAAILKQYPYFSVHALHIRRSIYHPTLALKSHSLGHLDHTCPLCRSSQIFINIPLPLSCYLLFDFLVCIFRPGDQLILRLRIRYLVLPRCHGQDYRIFL
jgi:hypothetical protein